MAGCVHKNLEELRVLTKDESARIDYLIDNTDVCRLVGVYCWKRNGKSHRHCGSSDSKENAVAHIHEWIIPRIKSFLSGME